MAPENDHFADADADADAGVFVAAACAVPSLPVSLQRLHQ